MDATVLPGRRQTAQLSQRLLLAPTLSLSLSNSGSISSSRTCPGWQLELRQMEGMYIMSKITPQRTVQNIKQQKSGR